MPPADLSQIGSEDPTVQWFDKEVEVPEPARELLENYSKIPADEVAPHIIAVRDKAWKVFPFPCLGQFRFLDLNLSDRGDLYTRLLSRLKGGEKFLDVGCCLGQDIRKLIYDGAPGASLVGAELNGPFIDLGYELFKDKDSLEAQFLTADILAGGPPLNEYEGQFDVVQLGMILHLFTLEEQKLVFANAIKLLKPEEKGSLIIGQAVGNLEGLLTPAGRKQTFKHSVETFKQLIADVSKDTSTQWKVNAELDNGLSIFDGKRTWDNPSTRRLIFEIERE